MADKNRPPQRDFVDRSEKPDGPTRHKLRKKPGLAARGAALDLLRLIRNGRSLDDALDTCRSFDALEGPDRAFARQLATTVLRRQGSLDGVIEHFLFEPLAPHQHEVRAILRLTAAQILLLDTPPHAAASTAVDLARERGDTAGFAKLVNAISRKLAPHGGPVLEEQSLRSDTPGWLWRRLERVYGPKEVRAMALAHRQAPALDITPHSSADRAELIERLPAVEVGPVTLRRFGGGRIEELPGFDRGQWWVQDVAATLPAHLTGDIAGKVVFDLCAAPGGKTMQLANAGAKVTAVDISPRRVQALEANLARVGFEANVVVCDVLEFAPPFKADVILLDAPCTATGTIRRNPDLLWSKREEEINTLSILQDRMIDHAVSLLNPGGLLIFATCSLLPDEGEKRIAAALERHPALSRMSVEPDEVGGLPVINKDGEIRCRPSLLADQSGMDGFFAARLKLADE